jgi:hypothetical protein
LATNRDALKTCGLSKACDSAFAPYATCQARQSFTDAAATTTGAGGGSGGCDYAACEFNAEGTVNCTQTCDGVVRSSQCTVAANTYVCACTSGEVYEGSCIGAPNDGSDPSLTIAPCCVAGL